MKLSVVCLMRNSPLSLIIDVEGLEIKNMVLFALKLLKFCSFSLSNLFGVHFLKAILPNVTNQTVRNSNVSISDLQAATLI